MRKINFLLFVGAWVYFYKGDIMKLAKEFGYSSDFGCQVGILDCFVMSKLFYCYKIKIVSVVEVLQKKIVVFVRVFAIIMKIPIFKRFVCSPAYIFKA